MFDFKKMMGDIKKVPDINPQDIFNHLEKSDPTLTDLRPSQKKILDEWFSDYKNNEKYNDLIIKMPTGQGKTLVGLLILQSYLNNGEGPCLYLCPNQHLEAQTIEQANKFGIKIISLPEYEEGKGPIQIPIEFENSDMIMVTRVKRMFTSQSVFGIDGKPGRNITKIGAIVVDDAHLCMDHIQERYSIIISKLNPKEKPLYDKIIKTFEDDLKSIYPSKFENISYNENDVIEIPFWIWSNKLDKIRDIIRTNIELTAIKWTKDLFEDYLDEYICLIHGSRIEITPRSVIPVEKVPSFNKAKKRLFLSATLTEDAFLVKGLGLNQEVILHPLKSDEPLVNGMRLIVSPFLIEKGIILTDHVLKEWIAAYVKKDKGLPYGVFAIVPSNKKAKGWATTYNGRIIEPDQIIKYLHELKEKLEKNNVCDKIGVFVNKYDGIDLPDQMCRILCIDSLPGYSLLIEQYLNSLMQDSTQIKRKTAQRIEQGFGRAIRGVNDFAIVFVIGADISQFINNKVNLSYFSNELRSQLIFGGLLIDQIKGNSATLDQFMKSFETLIVKLIDKEIKPYYVTFLEESMKPNPDGDKAKIQNQLTILNISKHELKAAEEFRKKRNDLAIQEIQEILNTNVLQGREKGWYFQMLAYYNYFQDRTLSFSIQKTARALNILLPPPPEIEGTIKDNIDKIRINNLKNLQKSKDLGHIQIELNQFLANINFDMESEEFEISIEKLGIYLGLNTKRAHRGKERRDGGPPDVLWEFPKNNFYWIIECKNESTSSTICRTDAGQMGQSILWFKENHPNADFNAVFLHLANEFEKDAYPSTETCYCINPDVLSEIKVRLENFYLALSPDDSEDNIGLKLGHYMIDHPSLSKLLKLAVKKKI